VGFPAQQINSAIKTYILSLKKRFDDAVVKQRRLTMHAPGNFLDRIYKMERSCATCAWAEDSDDDDPAILLCRFPTSRLPLCMQGVAQREREPVKATATGCPVHAEKELVEL
jgi:hypothetical protein